MLCLNSESLSAVLQTLGEDSSKSYSAAGKFQIGDLVTIVGPHRLKGYTGTIVNIETISGEQRYAVSVRQTGLICLISKSFLDSVHQQGGTFESGSGMNSVFPR